MDCWPRVSPHFVRRVQSNDVFFAFSSGLLLHGDNTVQLVVLCAEKPTTSLLKRVVTELPIQLKKVTEEQKYTVTMAPVEGAVLVSDGTISVKISLTSPLLREGKCPASDFSFCSRHSLSSVYSFIIGQKTNHDFELPVSMIPFCCGQKLSKKNNSRLELLFRLLHFSLE